MIKINCVKSEFFLIKQIDKRNIHIVIEKYFIDNRDLKKTGKSLMK
jgi:hypothetical protein